MLHGAPKPQPRVLYMSVPPAYAATELTRQSYRGVNPYNQNYRSSAPAPPTVPAPASPGGPGGGAYMDPNRQQSYRSDDKSSNLKRGSFSRESSLKRSRSSDRQLSSQHTVHFVGVPPSTISNRSAVADIGVRPHPAFAIGIPILDP